VVQSGKTFYKQETFIKKSSTEGHVNSRPTVKLAISNVTHLLYKSNYTITDSACSMPVYNLINELNCQ
jgi:hypothetical protein